MAKTVIEHVFSRLPEIGVNDVFGVAGDYAFPIDDAVCNSDNIRWIGSCNELNAAYSADGYARIRGIGPVLTDFNSGSFTARIDRSKSLNLLRHNVRVGEAVYNNIEMKDVLGAPTRKVSRPFRGSCTIRSRPFTRKTHPLRHEARILSSRYSRLRPPRPVLPVDRTDETAPSETTGVRLARKL
jgi:TPP-dependent 2-oxoacid decarboxylase